MRDADRGASDKYWKRRAHRRCSDYDWLYRWQDTRCKCRAGAKPRAIGTVRCSSTLVRIRMIVLRVNFGGLVGGTALDDLAVRAKMDVGVREDRGQRRKRCREPSDQQVPAHFHQLIDSRARKYDSRAGVSAIWNIFSTSFLAKTTSPSSAPRRAPALGRIVMPEGTVRFEYLA